MKAVKTKDTAPEMALPDEKVHSRVAPTQFRTWYKAHPGRPVWLRLTALPFEL